MRGEGAQAAVCHPYHAPPPPFLLPRGSGPRPSPAMHHPSVPPAFRPHTTPAAPLRAGPNIHSFSPPPPARRFERFDEDPALAPAGPSPYTNPYRPTTTTNGASNGGGRKGDASSSPGMLELGNGARV